MNIAVVGCGLRGAIAAALLAGAGVDQLSLIDGAFVEEEDLGRHPLQFTPDLRLARADALGAKVGLINPKVLAQPFPAFLDEDNCAAILSGADCAIDCAGDEGVTAAILAGAQTLGIPVILPPEDFDAAGIDSARACAVGALQAGVALDPPAIGQFGEAPTFVRVDTV